MHHTQRGILVHAFPFDPGCTRCARRCRRVTREVLGPSTGSSFSILGCSDSHPPFARRKVPLEWGAGLSFDDDSGVEVRWPRVVPSIRFDSIRFEIVFISLHFRSLRGVFFWGGEFFGVCFFGWPPAVRHRKVCSNELCSELNAGMYVDWYIFCFSCFSCFSPHERSGK